MKYSQMRRKGSNITWIDNNIKWTDMKIRYIKRKQLNVDKAVDELLNIIGDT